MKKFFTILLVAMVMPLLAVAQDYNRSITYVTNTNVHGTNEDRLDVDHGITGLTNQSDCNIKSVSMGAWVRMTSFTSSSNTAQVGNAIAQYGGLNHNNANGLLVLKTTSDGKIALGGFGVNDGDRLGLTDVTTNQVITLNEWHYVAVAADFENSQIRVYYDGMNVKTIAIPAGRTFGSFDDTPYGFGFGGMTFNGSMDDIHIVDGAITDEEAVYLYNDQASKVKNLVGWYTFDKVTDTNHFTNEVASKSEYDAVYYKISGSTNSDGGLINVARSNSTPDLTTITEETQRVKSGADDVDYSTVEGRWAVTVVDCTDDTYAGAEEVLYFNATLDGNNLAFTSEDDPSYTILATYNDATNYVEFIKNPLGKNGVAYLQEEPFIRSGTARDFRNVRGTYNPENGQIGNFQYFWTSSTYYDVLNGWGIVWNYYETESYVGTRTPMLAYVVKSAIRVGSEGITKPEPDYTLTIGDTSVATDKTQATVYVKNITMGESIEELVVEYALNSGEYLEMENDGGEDYYYAVINFEDLTPGSYDVDVKVTAYADGKVVNEVEDYAGNFTVEDESDGISGIATDNTDNVRYFNLQGVEITEPTPGMYIRVEGNHATKAYVK